MEAGFFEIGRLALQVGMRFLKETYRLKNLLNAVTTALLANSDVRNRDLCTILGNYKRNA